MNNGGKIILNSQNRPSAEEWQSRQLRFEFDGRRGEITALFDIGERLLAKGANRLGFATEPLGRDDHGNYVSLLKHHP